MRTAQFCNFCNISFNFFSSHLEQGHNRNNKVPLDFCKIVVS